MTESDNQAEGFLIQALDPSGTRIGAFHPSSGSKLLDCSDFSSIPKAVRMI